MQVEREDVSVIVYDRLWNTMKEKGITSYRLRKLGFPRSTYYAMKRGDNISSHTVNQLCKILKCGVSDIMEYIEEA